MCHSNDYKYEQGRTSSESAASLSDGHLQTYSGRARIQSVERVQTTQSAGDILHHCGKSSE